jgi:CysZ protein
MGLLAPWQGLALVARSRRLFLLALAPALISSALFVVGLVWATAHLGNLVRWFWGNVAASASGSHPWLLTGAIALSWVAFVPALAFALFLAARILAGPFNSLLAESALEILRARPAPRVAGLAARLSRVARMSAVALAQEAILAVCAICFFFVSLLPAMGLFAIAGYLALAAFDSVSYALEACGHGLRARIAFFRLRLFAYAGFALAMAAMLAVPGLNLFAYPIAVAGGACLVAELTAAP